MNPFAKKLGLTALVLAFTLGLAACDSILEVDNPNSLIEEDLDSPAASTAMANGAEAAVTRALGAILAPYATATDEATWIGSRDAWSELDIGIISNVRNEFSDAAFPYVGEARWMANEFIGRLEGFREEGELSDERDLVRTYLYGAIIYTTIADVFDDFAFSNRREGAAPIGEANMQQLHDTALGFVESALALGPDADLVPVLLGLRARILFQRALWEKVNPTGDVNTADPLVDSEAAVEAADSALTTMVEDYAYELELTPSAPDLVVGDLSFALQVNSRQELRISDTYIYGTDDKSAPDSIRFEDLITGVVHPHLAGVINTFTESDEYADIVVVSAREMYLIKAEVALAQDDEEGFAEAINDLRALDDLPAYEGDVDPQALLINQRQANLFLQMRRLFDHYRFEDPAQQWTAERDTPGTFFPITITEIRANPQVGE